MLYIMRHGKTDWNEQHKLQGRTDIPLNDDGIKMAEAAALKYVVASTQYNVSALAQAADIISEATESARGNFLFII